MPTFNSNKSAASYAKKHYGEVVSWHFHFGGVKVIILGFVLLIAFVWAMMAWKSPIFILIFLYSAIFVDNLVELYAFFVHGIRISRRVKKTGGWGWRVAYIYPIEVYKNKYGGNPLLELLLGIFLVSFIWFIPIIGIIWAGSSGSF